MTERQTGVWVGIDIAKAHYDVQLGDDGPARQYPNRAAGHRRFVADLATYDVAGLVVEATGPYHQQLVVALTDAGYPPAVLNPQWFHAFKRSEGKRSKTDQADARLLARYGAQKQPRPARPTTARERELRELVARRDDLVTTRAAEKNRHKIATVPSVVTSIAAHIAWLTEEITRLEAEIDTLIAQDEAMAERRARVRSMPGVGPVSSAELIANLPELGEMDRRQVAAIVGVAPYTQESGTQQRPRRIAGGRARLRQVLYQAATAAAHADPTFRAQKQRMAARGKSHKQIIVAILRRMLGILTAMVRDNLDWQDTRIGQGVYLGQPST